MTYDFVLKIVDNLNEFQWESSINEFVEKVIELYKESDAENIINYLLCLCINEKFLKSDSERLALVILFRVMDESEAPTNPDKLYYRKLLFNLFLMTSFGDEVNLGEVSYLKFSKNRLTLLEYVLIGNIKSQTLVAIDQLSKEDAIGAKELLYSKDIYNSIFPIIFNPMPNTNINFDKNMSCTNESIAKTVHELASGIQGNEDLFLKPSFFTPIPEQYDNGSPELFNDFLLEFRLSDYNSTPIIEAFRQSINQAIKISLPMVEYQQIKEQIIKYPELVGFINIDRNNIASFVEYNPLIALEVLNEMINRCNIRDHLNALVNMEVSLASIEVMNRLAMVLFCHLTINKIILILAQILY
ncbi:MAG: hypothetical protein MHMPM18_000687 [Marteilia pararefringens]